ncbi:MAG: VOC family protein [Actinobacteria bacterium]|nr:VOC family protein [Actinomycetota bacterium]
MAVVRAHSSRSRDSGVLAWPGVRLEVEASGTGAGRHPGGPARWPGWPSSCRLSAVSNPEPEHARWPAHLPVGALRVVRWCARYDQTVSFYRDVIGLPVLETFHDSYGLDGTILGLPGGPVHLELVRLQDAPQAARGLDQLVFYLPDAVAQERITARLAAAGIHPVAQIDYWQANGGVTYQDPDGREVVFASWIYRPPA